MIVRTWHGWTTRANADAYERLLRDEIFTGIRERRIPGFLDIRLLRREAGDDVEFVTIMDFATLDGVRAFAGNDYEAAVVPPRARAILSRFDTRSQHYELRTTARPEPAGAEHYTWGNGCDGWHLVNQPALSIIRERMPPGTSEVRHVHLHARQYFFVLSGAAVLEVDGTNYDVFSGQGLHVAPGLPHQIFNHGVQPLEFLVVSQPHSHGDRVVI